MNIFKKLTQKSYSISEADVVDLIDKIYSLENKVRGFHFKEDTTPEISNIIFEASGFCGHLKGFITRITDWEHQP